LGVEARVDVFDLIINALSEHERRFDDLVARLEKTLDKSTSSDATADVHIDQAKPVVSATLACWQEFKQKCVGSNIVAFNLEEKRFKVSGVKDGVLFTYQEELPDMEIRLMEKNERAVADDVDGDASIPTVLRSKLKCGLEVSVNGVKSKQPNGVVAYKVNYDLNEKDVRAWLVLQLKTDKRNVIQGKLLI